MTHCPAEPQAAFDYQLPSSDSFTIPTPKPIRIYVACLAAYNNGHLHGRWIEISDESAIWQDVKAMLATSPIEEDAEEWAIHDYEGFEGAEVGEYFSFSSVVALADYIRERGELGAHLLNYYGGNIEDAKARFDEYAGEYESLEAYAEELTDEQSGDFLTFEVSGSVHIFWAN